MPRARGMAACVQDVYGAFRQRKCECGMRVVVAVSYFLLFEKELLCVQSLPQP